jgi:hypothetical protein
MTITIEEATASPDAFRVIKESQLARAESEIVGLRLPLVSRWRRNLRYAYGAGYLVALNAACHHRPLLEKL